ncbi:MAG: ATP-binding protein [Raineya sp.]|jgi:signal transduction histidine kinase/HPt (histidine-containing phosphotransfer) domain-containing protein|nr:ATP-binding protein [Raineya sp.]
MNVLSYKQKYLSEQSHYQFILLDEDLNILDSCNTLWSYANKIRKNIVDIFPFIENLKEAIQLQSEVFIPSIDLALSKDKPAIYDFFFMKEKDAGRNFILCIIKDVGQASKFIIEHQQEARLAMLENEYLELQNKNYQLENTLLQIRNRELQKNKELKNLFFSKISHELRSPVNGILGLSQVILEQENPQGETKAYIESIYTAAKHLRVILDDILDISKLEAGNIVLNKANFQLNAIFQHLQLNFLHILEQKKLTLHFQVDENVPTYLIGDEVRLTQIFYNLLSNAIKFTEKGGVFVKVVLESKISENKCIIRFQVRDTGVGMREDQIIKIFDPYEQIGEHSYQSLGGTGLGLSVVKQLVELQKGTIDVESVVGEGTIFVFSLPLEYQKDIKTNENNIDKTIKKFYGLKALIADDSAISRLYTKKILEEQGFIVQTTESGSQALEAILQEYYDLFITDLKMPDMDGDMVVEKFLLQNKYDQKTAIVFATGSIGLRKINYPALLKPFGQEQLYKAIENIIPEEKKQVYGLEYLFKITDNNQEFMQDMMDSFIKAAPEDMNRIADTIALRDGEGLHKAVHKLKPIATIMGNNVLARLLHIMEFSCLGEHVNWGKLQEQSQEALKLIQISLDFFLTQQKSR